MAKILIVDDDPQLRQSFEKLLTQEDHAVQAAATAEAGLDIVGESPPDLVIMDVRLPGMNGLEGSRAMRKVEPKLPIIIMTAYGSTETAIEATKEGAFDYVLKPFHIPDILVVIKNALEAGRIMRSRVEMDGTSDTPSPDVIIGRSKPMQEVYKAIGRVASTDATVLIRGESGTGKELVARAIYQHSKRADRPFLVINCVAIPETLLESELFGYEKGAFTGAVSRRVGKIQQANGGTIFLDEIGDMPLSIQAKILRLLQEKSIERLGGREPIPVDVRIIAATNRDLEAAIAEGRFREDLYFRLKVVTIWLPPLRQRSEDIEPLADYFLARLSADMKMDNPGMTSEAKSVLHSYSWSGNVRELSNTLQKVLIFNQGVPLGAEDLSKAIHGGPEIKSVDKDSITETIRQWFKQRLASSHGENLFDSLIDDTASIVISEALNLTGGNRSRAAKLLGLSRPTLQAKIEKYRLKIETSVSSS